MKVARLASGLGFCLWLSACGMQRAPEASAPAASATSNSPTPTEETEARPESPAAAPAAPPASGPQGLDAKKSKASEAEFSSLAEAERALNQAKADLDRLAIAEPPATLSRDRAEQSSKPSRAPSATGAATPAKTSVCEEACRAFSSLARAARAVCRLDGSAGVHCSRAKVMLADAQQRVASCSCPASSD